MGHEIHEARGADQVRKLGAQIDLDVLGVEALERAVARLLKEEQDRHDRTGMEARRALASSRT